MSAANWLHSSPKKAPADPPVIDFEKLLIANQGRASKSINYLRQHGPKQTFDEWGQPLPLSSVAQYDLDRLVAVMKDPIIRTRDLMFSGLLNSDEVAAVKAVHPEVYAQLRDAAFVDMMQTKPPFEVWAVGVLGILFQKPAPQMYADAQQAPDDSQQPGAAMGGPGPTGLPGAMPTQSDRRETAVREQARR
jgi:hypothetical protein